MEMKHPKLDVKGKIIPSSIIHLQPRRTKAKMGGSIKIGCKCKSMVKQLYYDSNIAEIVYHNLGHVNNDRLIIHNDVIKANLHPISF